jgi:hypothetical protein
LSEWGVHTLCRNVNYASMVPTDPCWFFELGNFFGSYDEWEDKYMNVLFNRLLHSKARICWKKTIGNPCGNYRNITLLAWLKLEGSPNVTNVKQTWYNTPITPFQILSNLLWFSRCFHKMAFDSWFSCLVQTFNKH